MQEQISFFTGFNSNDLWFLGEAALKTLWISALSISIGSVLGCVFGWIIHESKWAAGVFLSPILDAFRSIPLIIQLVLFYNFAPMIGLDLNPFMSGVIILTFYTASLVTSVARGGIESVPLSMRRASRSLGMSYWQDLFYVVLPIGGRTVFPAWIGVVLSVMKDSALVSVLGYVELLKASQILITRTQEPLLILTIAGVFYFALSYPISLYASKFEQRWTK
jgi:hydroxyproline transport system permease protein